ncbi:MAG TPA: DUF2917 domain-containing protein [Methylibium sp.]|uniref:DUF2917 domain-containing protein n=1 Tax=Methylibium sp. TaxID=2067992 RepID=UPI002DBE66AF|nr:DUF2917 domain-containing protein [Methylibium sp.]HEU4457882.1 DUF2917 domain-containing protein [Methylibium sp.]
MNTRIKTSSPQPRNDARWFLPQGRALTLPGVSLPRRLRLVEGRLWLTEEGRREDHWLEAGDSLRLEPGRSVLAEGWPTASFEVLEEPHWPPRRAKAARPAAAPGLSLASALRRVLPARIAAS